ncbi:uncharacterized protein OCT59_017892 [Rhizophagus irregularis]|uniref:uncharacterized protein n=1 Tax=Rhizophagus irregularis TaxID=588596 RepID=UPI0033263D16|nr:hypothetical protein OCT59_017892 [Rhizophagus irregularis]
MYSFSVSSLEEALSCIPPPITYFPKCTTLKNSIKVSGDPPTSVQLWDDFFDKVNQFKRPQLIPDNEEDVRVANDINICMVLNRLLRLEYKFARCSSNTTGAPDFTCHYIVELLILVVKVKRKHVLEDIGEQTFSEFYKTKNGDLTNLQLYGGKINVKDNPESPHPQVVVSAHGDNNSCTLWSHSKSSSNSSLNQQQFSSTFANQQSSSNTSVK